jgi:diacylglycerol kinase
MSVAVFVVILMLIFHLRQWEYAFLTYTIGSVLILELINTVFERVTDILQPRMHPYAQAMKDLMAAAVLIASFGAVVIGIIILGPHVENALRFYLYP